jgi:hypothetical protein
VLLLCSTQQLQSDIIGSNQAATTFAIGVLLLCAVAIPVHAMTMTDADANDGRTSNFDPALNLQPNGGVRLV